MNLRPLSLLLPLLLASMLGADETADTEEITVPLKPGTPDEKTRITYSRPKPLPIERTVPRLLFEVPDLKAEDPLFARMSLGETKGLPFYVALDRSPGTGYHDLLYIDRNRDLDLTNDGGPLKGAVRTYWQTGQKLVEFLGVELELPHTIDGKEQKSPYRCLLYYLVEPGEAPVTIQVDRDGWREGRVSLKGKAYRVAVLDDDTDGQYTTGDTWSLLPADAEGDLLGRDATRTMLFPSWTNDEKWTVEVKSVDPAGRDVTLRVDEAKESEREFFVRVARRNQSPEERALKIDPLRPKADKDEKVLWLEGKDLQYALDIGAKVKKRVLVDFTSDGCVWCDRMEKYSFRDREVVDLTKRFVCIRLEHPGEASRRYGVEGTPTYVVLDPDGTEVHRQVGFARPRDFAFWLKSATR